jgi:hypothetical protein
MDEPQVLRTLGQHLFMFCGLSSMVICIFFTYIAVIDLCRAALGVPGEAG